MNPTIFMSFIDVRARSFV